MGRSSAAALTGMDIRLQERNKEIGAFLAAARRQRGLTIRACADYIATTPRRYRAIEQGDAPVHAVELEALAPVLQLSSCPLQIECPSVDPSCKGSNDLHEHS